MPPNEKRTEKSSKLAHKYEAALIHLSPIAKPLASRKETRHIYKLVKKASRHAGTTRGIKEVSKSLKKGSTGICILAGDIYPIDVIAHLPILCEEKKVSYIYVPSKEDLGIISCAKRPTSCIFVNEPKKNSSYEDLYERVKGEIEAVWSYTKF